MGTRGLWGYKIDGTVKVFYNHFDSYPDGLGQVVLDHARRFAQPDTRDDAIAAVRALRVLPAENTPPPTPDDIRHLARYANANVGEQVITDWYVLLRETQGDPAKTLAAGVQTDGFPFGFDSLFCEWGYVIDVDGDAFDVYRGFQKTPATDGEWVVETATPFVSVSGWSYHSINRVASFLLAALPDEITDAMFYTDEERADADA